MRAFCFLIFPPFILTRGKREREREKEKKPIYFSLFSFIFQEEVKRVWFHGPVCCRCRCFCCCCWMHLTNVEGPFLFWTLSAADCNGSPVSRRRRRREVLRLPEAPSFQLSTLVSIFSLFLYFSFSFSLSLSVSPSLPSPPTFRPSIKEKVFWERFELNWSASEGHGSTFVSTKKDQWDTAGIISCRVSFNDVS